jgi:hypothetical protein
MEPFGVDPPHRQHLVDPLETARHFPRQPDLEGADVVLTGSEAPESSHQLCRWDDKLLPYGVEHHPTERLAL